MHIKGVVSKIEISVISLRFFKHPIKKFMKALISRIFLFGSEH